ncbi:DUF1254 domain-containing protein [Ruegeria atlantica]|uniref:DUF1254 domain-containing protein n=1 Tax=Ruegeria atlantica TaxID=81569 RepID=A0AA91BUH5_9RHOB|nr:MULTISPECIES: DUF1254 domain-containing protein [Ruegeria]NOC85926.1 DUF1254 domain-containing protein [Ruegeria sp. HKCCD6428]NOC94548.1 DUF1254 domain-containing protein [Ruegeria sp. HKCCD6604]NOE19093.1 DUF1254 domain-containing protein [Ruegeria atlantica]
MKKLLLTVALTLPTGVWAEDMVDVTVDTLVRAETDHMFRTNMANLGLAVGELGHMREATTPDNQPVIRMNQDTLYSGILLDLSEPVEVTLPKADGRYISMHVINQDHFMYAEAEPGTYQITQEDLGTRFGFIAFRTFVDVTDPDDIAAAQAAQDGIVVSGGGTGPFDAPNWNTEQLATARQAINDLSLLGTDSARAFGRTKDEIDPVQFLVGAFSGWGGLPPEAAIYLLDAVDQNDGETPHAVTVKDVPVRAFWSVTVYNGDGFLEANDLGVNSYNGYTAEAAEDGSVTLHFGGCDDGRVNCLPITSGWNYAIRLYEPEDAILNGNWTFPKLEPIN